MNKQQEIIGSGCGADAFLLRGDPFFFVAVVAAALEAQVDGGHAGVHRPGGALPPGIRRQGQSVSLSRQILLSLSLRRQILPPSLPPPVT